MQAELLETLGDGQHCRRRCGDDVRSSSSADIDDAADWAENGRRAAGPIYLLVLLATVIGESLRFEFALVRARAPHDLEQVRIRTCVLATRALACMIFVSTTPTLRPHGTDRRWGPQGFTAGGVMNSIRWTIVTLGLVAAAISSPHSVSGGLAMDVGNASAHELRNPLRAPSVRWDRTTRLKIMRSTSGL
jgi:hypothetical protein